MPPPSSGVPLASSGVPLAGGFPDLAGFGRRPLQMDIGELVAHVVYQLGALAGVARVAEAALARFGRVDILVTNAGGPPAGSCGCR